MSWEEVNFKSFITLQRGFDLTRTNMKGGQYPVIGSNCIIGYHNQYKDEAPGVVTGRSGTLGEVQFINTPYFPHNTSLWVKDFKGNDPKFVYYKLKTLDLAQYNGGGAVPTLNRNNLDNLLIKLPPSPTQSKIAAILSAYDDLIENNLKRIRLLEEAARLLYREWFVRLRFPGHEHTRITDGVPDGWEKKKLGDVLTLNYGKALKQETRQEGTFPVYGSSGVVGTHNTFLVKAPGIVVGRKGNVGSIYWAHKPFFPIDTVYYINSEQSSFFLYHNLQNRSFMNSDGAVPGLNRNYAYSLPIVIPSKTIREQFEEIAVPVFQQVFKLEAMNQKLKHARDVLLPRLMSGALEV